MTKALQCPFNYLVIRLWGIVKSGLFDGNYVGGKAYKDASFVHVSYSVRRIARLTQLTHL